MTTVPNSRFVDFPANAVICNNPLLVSTAYYIPTFYYKIQTKFKYMITTLSLYSLIKARLAKLLL